MRRLSQEEIEAEVYQMYGDEYVIKSQYMGNQVPIDILHKKCGNVFTCNCPISFRQGKTRCPYCTPGSNAINDDVFKYRVSKLVGDEYTPLSDYKSATKKVLFRHNKCSHPNGFFDFEMTPHMFCDGGHRCPYDSHQHGYTIDDYKERLYKYHPNYKCIGTEYINSRTNIDVECEKHHVFGLSLDNIKKGCPYCSNHRVYKGYNDLWTTHPHIAKLLKNPEDGYKYMYGSCTELDFICPICGEIIHKIPSLLLNGHGQVICICNDNFSYPEKFVYNFLKQLNIDFIYQLSSSTYKWCGKYRYDFYIPEKRLIIEVHGRQHYGIKMFQNPDDIHKNDLAKYELAIKNGCNYCVIDAKLSTCEYILNSIKNSSLPNILNFIVENIDWIKCDMFASKPIIFDIVDLWNKSKDIKYISKELKISKSTVYRYLEQGNNNGLCSFNKTEYINNINEMRKNKLPTNARKVMSVETGIIYKSIAEAERLCKAYLSPQIIGNPNKTSAKQHWVYV